MEFRSTLVSVAISFLFPSRPTINNRLTNYCGVERLRDSVTGLDSSETYVTPYRNLVALRLRNFAIDEALSLFLASKPHCQAYNSWRKSHIETIDPVYLSFLQI